MSRKINITWDLSKMKIDMDIRIKIFATLSVVDV